jgi:hypothetical protein
LPRIWHFVSVHAPHFRYNVGYSAAILDNEG